MERFLLGLSVVGSLLNAVQHHEDNDRQESREHGAQEVIASTVA